MWTATLGQVKQTTAANLELVTCWGAVTHCGAVTSLWGLTNVCTLATHVDTTQTENTHTHTNECTRMHTSWGQSPQSEWWECSSEKDSALQLEISAALASACRSRLNRNHMTRSHISEILQPRTNHFQPANHWWGLLLHSKAPDQPKASGGLA